MDFGESVATCFQKYFVFKGRARRSEYWWFYLFTMIGGIIASVIDAAIFGLYSAADTGIVNSLFSLVVLIPSISAACRRLHDTSRSGWWQLLPLVGIIALIPGFILTASMGEGGLGVALIVIGFLAIFGLVILLIVWLATDGDEDPNRFGDNPKGSNIGDTFS